MPQEGLKPSLVLRLRGAEAPLFHGAEGLHFHGCASFLFTLSLFCLSCLCSLAGLALHRPRVSVSFLKQSMFVWAAVLSGTAWRPRVARRRGARPNSLPR